MNSTTGGDARPNSDLSTFLQTAPPKSPSQSPPPKTTFLQQWKDVYSPAQPDPWLPRKFAIGIIIALTVWSFYVVAGRICVPALQLRSNQDYGRGTGVGTLVGFIILWFLFVWSYMKMIITGPGFANKIISQSPAPPTSNPSTSYIPYRPPHRNVPVPDESPDSSELAAFSHMVRSTVNMPQIPSSISNSNSNHNENRSKTGKLVDEIERPVPFVETGVRWCRFCKIVKPDRTHHCRHCGTCVLQFDHHCVWIGQCVGWANHKFFIIFNFWASWFCLYIFIFLILSSSRNSNIDGQVIALIICSGFFAIFTVTMLGTHIYLLLTGKTTLESYSGRDQMEMEDALLQREFGYVFRDHDKRKVRKRWRDEFGGVEVDERWRFGSWKDRWIQEMGVEWYGWLFPIGRPLGDGLHFPSNPAFGPNGEWLKRKDWKR